MADCTIVVPCYNEAKRLDATAFERFARNDSRTRLLLVDDGSTDGTLEVLETLHRSRPEQFEFLSLSRNSGKAEAVRRGICRALEDHPKMVGFWDADLATPLEAIPDFRRILESNAKLQMVFGARVKLLGRKIERRAVRHYLGRIFATAGSIVLSLPIYDTQCGAKLFRVTDELHDVFNEPFRTNWIFDVELLARFIRFRRANELPSIEQCIYELPLQQWLDVSGSKVRPHHFVKAFFELMQIYWTYLRPGAAAPPSTLARHHTDADSRPRRAA